MSKKRAKNTVENSNVIVTFYQNTVKNEPELGRKLDRKLPYDFLS